MLRRLFVAFVPAMALLLSLPATSQAQFKQKDWDLTLSGSGTNDRDFRTFTASATAGIGWFWTDQFEIGARPSVNISDGGSDYLWNIAAFGDWHFDLGNGWLPFVGANIGYQFGGGEVEDGWSAGPEGGIKYFVNATTYVYGSVTYEFNLNDGIDSGAWVYGLGLGVKL
jgi:hypothetical protein